MRRLAVCALIILVLAVCGCTWIDRLAAAPLLVTLSATPDSGPAPLSIVLTALAPENEDDDLVYTWDPGDGTEAFVAGHRIEHIYSQSGAYIAHVDVTDGAGRSSSAEISIDVTNTPPIATFRLSNTAPVPGEYVVYDASGSIDLDGAVVDFVWAFGDGETLRGSSVRHAYEQVGVYTVRLTITDDSGATASATHDVDVHTGVEGGGCCGGGSICLF